MKKLQDKENPTQSSIIINDDTLNRTFSDHTKRGEEQKIEQITNNQFSPFST